MARLAIAAAMVVALAQAAAAQSLQVDGHRATPGGFEGVDNVSWEASYTLPLEGGGGRLRDWIRYCVPTAWVAEIEAAIGEWLAALNAPRTAPPTGLCTGYAPECLWMRRRYDGPWYLIQGMMLEGHPGRGIDSEGVGGSPGHNGVVCVAVDDP